MSNIRCWPFHFIHDFGELVTNQLPHHRCRWLARKCASVSASTRARARLRSMVWSRYLSAAIQWSKLFMFITVVGVRRSSCVNSFNHLLFYSRIFAFNEVIVTGHVRRTTHPTLRTRSDAASNRPKANQIERQNANIQLKSHRSISYAIGYVRLLLSFDAQKK